MRIHRSRSRSRRQLGAVLAVVLAAGLAVGGVTSSATATRAPAEREGCRELKLHRVFVNSEANWYHLDSYRTPAGQIETVKRFVRKDVDSGRTKLVFDMCQDLSTGKWKVRKLTVSAPHDDLSITREGKRITSIKPVDDPYGYGVFVRTRSKTAVSFVASRCSEKPMGAGWAGYSVLKGLLSLPWKVPTPVSVGMYVVGLALPDAPDGKYWCASMGDPMTLKFQFRASDGKPSAVWKGKHLAYVKTKDEEYPCGAQYYTYCARSDWQTVALTKS